MAEISACDRKCNKRPNTKQAERLVHRCTPRTARAAMCAAGFAPQESTTTCLANHQVRLCQPSQSAPSGRRRCLQRRAMCTMVFSAVRRLPPCMCHGWSTTHTHTSTAVPSVECVLHYPRFATRSPADLRPQPSIHSWSRLTTESATPRRSVHTQSIAAGSSGGHASSATWPRRQELRHGGHHLALERAYPQGRPSCRAATQTTPEDDRKPAAGSSAESGAVRTKSCSKSLQQGGGGVGHPSLKIWAVAANSPFVFERRVLMRGLMRRFLAMSSGHRLPAGAHLRPKHALPTQ